ncbi:MAG: hypothetical protein AUG45_04900 [Ktedonobacter sp. 13_1_20CM_3_54_15]|nr:MAG: hypothetical protein AUG45_04900 [Ktedonobacter sp. 13_1_20CM_3_54_15]
MARDSDPLPLLWSRRPEGRVHRVVPDGKDDVPTAEPGGPGVDLCAEERNGRGPILDEKSKNKTRDAEAVPGLIAEPTGTDGFRVLSHQFFPSSLPLQENCITSSKTFSLRMKKPREALLQFYNNRGQDQEIWHMVYPLQNGRLSYNVCLRRKNLSEQLRMTMASLMKRYGVCMGYPHRN